MPQTKCVYVLPDDALEAEAEAEAMAYLLALQDSIAGKVKDRDQVATFCHESFTILQATSQYSQPFTNDFNAFCALCEPAYVEKYLQRVRKYQDEPQALQRDQGWLASHGDHFSLMAVRHIFTKRKKEYAHGRR